MNDEFERRIARSLRSAGRTVVPSPTGYLRIRDQIEARSKRVRRVARVAVSSMTVLVVTVIGLLIATGGSGTRPAETAAPEGSGVPGYTPVQVPAGLQVVQVVNHDAGDSSGSEYFEVYRSADTESRIVVRQRPSVTPEIGNVSSVASGPLLAEISVQDDGSRVMRWLSDSGTEQEVSAWGVSDEELRLLATDIQGRAESPSTQLTELPVNMALVAEGELAPSNENAEFKRFTLESEEGSDRNVTIEVTIRSGNVLALEVMDAYSAEAEWVGEDKLLVPTSENEILVLWSPNEELVVETRTTGMTASEVLSFVDLLRPVEDAAWSELLAEPLDVETTITSIVTVAVAGAAGYLDGHSWNLVWPTEVSEPVPEADAPPPTDQEAVSEAPVAPDADSQNANDVASGLDTSDPADPQDPADVSDTGEVVADGDAVTESAGLNSSTDAGSGQTQQLAPVPEADQELDSEEDLGPQSCLDLFVDSLLIEERCDYGTTTRVQAFPAIDRILVVAYNPVGELWLGNTLVITTEQGVVDVVPDATAKGYIWLAWIEAEEIVSVTQLQLDGIVIEFALQPQSEPEPELASVQ